MRTFRAHAPVASQQRYNKEETLCVNTDKNERITHYVIVRQDLSLGSQFAQFQHASGESFDKSPVKCRNDDDIVYAVALYASNEYELLKLEQKLIKANICHQAIREPDIGNQLTAIGIVPQKRKLVKPFVGNFKPIK
jgi:peptidyl-tRNA hydrolase